MPLELLVLLAPGLVLLAALDAFSHPGRRPGAVLYRAEAAALGAFGVAIAATLWRILAGPTTVELVTPEGPFALVRLDWVSLPMLLLVTFIGWVVLRYSRVYLDGEARQGAFTGWLCLTLAMVLLLVQAAHLVLFALAWIGTSVALQRLLRPPARCRPRPSSPSRPPRAKAVPPWSRPRACWPWRRCSNPRSSPPMAGSPKSWKRPRRCPRCCTRASSTPAVFS
jgi:hypothetical protein